MKLARLMTAALLPALLGAATLTAVPVGIVLATAGKVLKSNAANPKGNVLPIKSRLFWQDTIRTGKKSQAQLLLLDRSSFTIGAQAVLTIDRFVYDPSRPRELSATAAKGAFRFMSGRRDARGSAAVTTPVGTIGIRGTLVDGVVGEDAVAIAAKEPAVGKVKSDKRGATLVVLRGPGAATIGGLTPGLVDVTGGSTTVTLNQPALAAYIPRAGAAPIGPFALSPAGLSRVQDLLQPSVAQGSGGSGVGLAVPAAILGGLIGRRVLGGGNGNDPQRCVPTTDRRC